MECRNGHITQPVGNACAGRNYSNTRSAKRAYNLAELSQPQTWIIAGQPMPAATHSRRWRSLPRYVFTVTAPRHAASSWVRKIGCTKVVIFTAIRSIPPIHGIGGNRMKSCTFVTMTASSNSIPTRAETIRLCSLSASRPMPA